MNNDQLVRIQMVLLINNDQFVKIQLVLINSDPICNDSGDAII